MKSLRPGGPALSMHLRAGLIIGVNGKAVFEVSKARGRRQHDGAPGCWREAGGSNSSLAATGRPSAPNQER